MLMHRPFTTGLFGMACCLGLIWQARPEPLQEPTCRAAMALAEAPPAPAVARDRGACTARSPAVNVVDISAGAATPELVAELIRLDADERVTAVDDHPVASDLAAGAWIAARFPGDHGGYIDLTVEGDGCSRRVLVLLH
jgi:hypothetical protein